MKKGLPMEDTDLRLVRGEVRDRFLRYVEVHTTSNPRSQTTPSSPGQWDLARMLADECRALGLEDVQLSDACYLTARLPGNRVDSGRRPLCLCAHLDTSPDCPGEGVKPMVHPSWDGSPIRLPGGPVLDPAADPYLASRKGDDIITSDGTTLLGADDKAGIAEILTALSWLMSHPDHPRPDIEVLITPDEEIGRGADRIPRELLRSVHAFTLDGSEEGTYNVECFHGWLVEAVFSGRMIHPGMARGVLVNPVAMASAFVANLPRSESPEATDGTFGYYFPQSIQATLEEARVSLILRDFSSSRMEQRREFLRRNAALVEAAFPGGSVRLEEREQYRNMASGLARASWMEALLAKAIREAGAEPRAERIRGGTDGARMTEAGILTPNIFAGGHNFHSLDEWIPLGAMEKAVVTVIRLVRLWILREELPGESGH